VVIIGSGWGVTVQAPAWKIIEGLEVVGMWCRSEDKVEALKQTLKLDNISTDWKKLICNPDVDIVSIVAPPTVHKEMALFALQANKHVLCEKPFAMNLAEAKEMLDAARSRPDRITWVDHELRFLNVFKLMKAAIPKYGKILSISSTGCYRREKRDWTWFDDENLGGGILGAVGSHFIDLVSWLTGLKISAVSAQLNTRNKTTRDQKPVTSDDWFLLNLRFGEIPGIIQYNTFVGSSTFHIVTISLEAASIVFENNRDRAITPQFSVRTNDGRISEAYVETSPPDPILDHMFGKGTWEIGKVLQRVLASADPVKEAAMVGACTWEDSVYVQAVTDAARISHNSNGVFVPVNLQI